MYQCVSALGVLTVQPDRTAVRTDLELPLHALLVLGTELLLDRLVTLNGLDELLLYEASLSHFHDSVVSL